MPPLHSGLTRLASRFIEAIQRYQGVEQESRKRQRAKIERQFRIVKPDASQQEVQAVVDSSSQGGQVFQQALLNSNRYGDARAAQREVQDRHAEILKIEQTMTELAQMFNDVGPFAPRLCRTSLTLLPLYRCRPWLTSRMTKS